MPLDRYPSPRMHRRQFCATVVSTAAALSGCLGPNEPDPDRARLRARYAPPTGTIEPGLRALWSGAPVSFIYVPPTYTPSQPLPLVVALHGAGGTAQGPLNLLRPYADADEFILVLPESERPTWDILVDDYGPDIATIDRALRLTFERCAIDPTRISLQGFSDGASYALGVGIINPEVFRRVAANSPGFVAPTVVQSTKPGIFISHGTSDPILPIDNASRQIVPSLESSGFTVTYVEFPGGHEVPPDVAQSTVDFMVA